MAVEETDGLMLEGTEVTTKTFPKTMSYTRSTITRLACLEMMVSARTSGKLSGEIFQIASGSPGPKGKIEASDRCHCLLKAA